MPVPQVTIKENPYTVQPTMVTKLRNKMWPIGSPTQKQASPYSAYVAKGRYLLTELSEQLLTENDENMIYE